MKTPVVVAISGSGRTLANLIARQSDFAYEVVGVVSSRPDIKGVAIAVDKKLPVLVHDFARDASSQALKRWLDQWPECWIALAGFTRHWPELDQYGSRTVNIHPALLPEFGGQGMYGLAVHRAVLSSGSYETGASVHFVSGDYDRGRVVSRIRVLVEPEETADRLAKKVFAAECRLYPETLHHLVLGKWPLKGNEVYDYGVV